MYERKLTEFYAALPEDKTIRNGTLLEFREQLQGEGKPSGTINLSISAINSLLEYSGRRELQLKDSLAKADTVAPEMTRAEYLRLLSAARALEKERSYLLVKVFANTGLNVRELPLVTVEAVSAGYIVVPDRGAIHIPPCLQRELLDYCHRKGRIFGPVFATAGGKALNRSAVNADMRRLAGDARVAEEKCNPITLRRLYLATREQIMAGMALLIEQSHDRLMEQEQLTAGWDSL